MRKISDPEFIIFASTIPKDNQNPLGYLFLKKIALV